MSCHSHKPTAGSENTLTPKEVIVDNDFLQPKDNADFKVLEATIENDILTMKVSYSGGCEAHEFNAYFSGIYMKSEPPKAGLFIHHINNGDMCKKLVTEELKFNLKTIRYPDKTVDYKIMVGMNNHDGYIEYDY